MFQGSVQEKKMSPVLRKKLPAAERERRQSPTVTPLEPYGVDCPIGEDDRRTDIRTKYGQLQTRAQCAVYRYLR